jgi:hypothetical protein
MATMSQCNKGFALDRGLFNIVNVNVMVAPPVV